MKTKILWTLTLLAVAGLTLAATFPPGYVGGRIYYGEIHVGSDGDDELVIPDGATLQYGSLINSGITSHVSTGAVWCSYSSTTAATIGSATLTGSGLDDCTSGGSFIGVNEKTFVVYVDAAGATDTFKWSNDGGTTWRQTGVAMTGSAQALSDGVTVTFAATTGHTETEYWTIAVTISGTQAYPTIGIPVDQTNVNFDYIAIGQSSDIPAGIKSIKFITSGAEVAYVRYRLIY